MTYSSSICHSMSLISLMWALKILPMKSLESEMSSGVPYYERDLLNVIRQGRGVPAVPLVMIGVEP